MKIGIVVSRGKNEDMGWLGKLPPSWTQYIYTPADVIVLAGKDYGREAGVYLEHIIKNWETLDDITIFTQAYPFDHNGKFIEEANSVVERIEGKRYIPLAHWYLRFNGQGSPEHPGLPVDRVYKLLWPDKAVPMMYEGFASGMFAVTKEGILHNSKDFYLLIKEIIDYTYLAPECYVIERFWRMIME